METISQSESTEDVNPSEESPLSQMPSSFEEYRHDVEGDENEDNNASEEGSNKDFERLSEIEGLLKKGDYLGIARLLPKEDREDFFEIVNEKKEEKLAKQFGRKIEMDNAETQEETDERRRFEDAQDDLLKTDLERSENREDLREHATTRLGQLASSLANGDYLSVGDKHFLEDNDEDAYSNAEQRRRINNKAEKYDNINRLGNLNNVGELENTKYRTIDAINRIIKDKQAQINAIGDYKNSIRDYDKELEQLYSVLNDISKLEDTMNNTAH